MEAVDSSETTILICSTRLGAPDEGYPIFDTDLEVCMAVAVEIVSLSLMVVCWLLWILLFCRNMLVAVRVRIWPGNVNRWEVLNFMRRN